MIDFEQKETQKPIIKVLGVGGGGSNAVTYMYQQGIKDVDFFICNTDYQALIKSTVPNKIILGSTGMGAGSQPAIGRESAIQKADEIREILADGTSMLFITAGMGGGTGTGAAPVIAQIARELGILTVGIVTRPFGFEGRKREQHALYGIEELKKYVDSILVISNDKLTNIGGNIRIGEAFGKADDVLKVAAKGIAEIITVTGRVNVDFEDVKTVMRNSGKAIMGAGIASGPNRAMEAVQMALNSPLLDDTDIKGAENVLLYITSGKEELQIEELTTITDYITERTGTNTNMIWGDGLDDELETEIAITLIATGFDRPAITRYDLSASQQNTFAQPAAKVAEPIQGPTLINHPVQNVELKSTVPNPIAAPNPAPVPSPSGTPVAENSPNAPLNLPEFTLFKPLEPIATNGPAIEQPFLFTAEPEKTENPKFEFDFSVNAPEPVAEAPAPVTEETGLPMEMLDQERKDRLRSASHSFRMKGSIEELEKVPAYMRKNIDIAEPANDNMDASRFTVNPGNSEQKPGLRENKYLYDNVD